MQYLLALAFGYLGGSIPTAYILARVTKHVDIRKVGSGNVGGSNVAAQVGLLPSIATMLFDLVKGALAVAILRRYDFPLEAQVLAGVAAVLGHNWPFWLGFVGGRGIATTGGVLFMFGPLETLLAGIVMTFTNSAVGNAPLTTNFSAWYAGNGLAVVAFFLALAAFGFYTSQAGRPICQNAPGQRTSN